MPFSRTSLLFFIGYLIINTVYAQAENEFKDDVISCPIPDHPPINTLDYNFDLDALNILSKSSVIEKNQLAKFSGGVTLN